MDSLPAQCLRPSRVGKISDDRYLGLCCVANTTARNSAVRRGGALMGRSALTDSIASPDRFRITFDGVEIGSASKGITTTTE